MAEETKTYVFGNDGGNSLAALAPALSNLGMSPALVSALANNNGFGGNGGWWIVILLMALWGRNGFGNENQDTNSILSALNNDTGRDMIMQAVQGNSQAISQLASTLNCDVNSLRSAIDSVHYSIQSVGSQIGLSSQQIINSIQAGNCQLASQLAQCCCDNKLLITTQGYENRIANQEQTNFLGSKIDYQTNIINDKFCQLEMREMQNKIDMLREEKSILQNTISNANQTAAIQSYVANVINPIAADVAAIKASQPPTVAVPYPQLSAVPASYLCALNANGLGPWGFYGVNNGSIWS